MVTKIKGQKAGVRSLPAPVGGLNARDPIADMAPSDAVMLDNFFCTPSDVGVRKGYSIQASGFPAAVNTLASYDPVLSASNKLFAWSSTNVYDSSNVGAIGAPVIQGCANSKFQTVNFGTAAGNFLVGVNGSDLPLLYNGTVWSNAFSAAFNTTISTLTSVGTTATVVMANPHNLKTGMSITIAGVTPAGYNGTYVITVTNSTTFTYTLAGALGVVTVMGTATPTLNVAITGVNPALFINLAVFKTRLWFIESNSLRAWYLPALSLGGAASSLDFSSLCDQGGNLVAMADWTLDAGQGVDDYLAFITSVGQVVVYKGTDPSSSTTWALVGVFNIGNPIGNRCFMKYAGDLLLICQDGLVPFSKALMSTRVNQKIALTDKVQKLTSAAITSYSANFGWQSVLFPDANMVILNVPQLNSTSIQFVMNTISGAWSTFSGWNAFCWEFHTDNIYFGGTNFVAKAWNGLTDNGAAITFEAQQSFNYFKNASQLKRVTLARPVISTDGTPSYSFGVNVDFDTSQPGGIPTLNPITAGVWGTAIWGSSVWGGGMTIHKEWQSPSAIGYCVSPHILGQLTGCSLNWSSTDLLIENGGVI